MRKKLIDQAYRMVDLGAMEGIWSDERADQMYNVLGRYERSNSKTAQAGAESYYVNHINEVYLKFKLEGR